MKELRNLALLIVVAHWIVAIWHLFLAAKVLLGPNNQVSWLAITLISCGHLMVSIALWTLRARLSRAVSLVFFLAALGADVYEHLWHASANNIFMVATSRWTFVFDASVFALLTLEILGCFLGILFLGGWPRRDHSGAEKSARPSGHESLKQEYELDGSVIAYRPLMRRAPVFPA